MGLDTRLTIRGYPYTETVSFIATLFRAKVENFKTGGSDDKILIFNSPFSSKEERELHIIYHEWGNEQDFNMTSKKGDIHLKLGYWGDSIKIMKLLVYYFGGYLSESDEIKQEYDKISKNYKKCIQLLFEG